jgi:predicted RecA/RadA family phage recombinase
MKNFLADGKTAVVAAPAAQVSGDFVIVGKTFGVAMSDALIGADVVLDLFGVFELAKTTGQAWSKGDKLYWDPATSKFTTVAGALVAYGIAHEAALAADTVGAVRLTDSWLA